MTVKEITAVLKEHPRPLRCQGSYCRGIFPRGQRSRLLHAAGGHRRAKTLTALSVKLTPSDHLQDPRLLT
jgi:hypothetical protein